MNELQSLIPDAVGRRWLKLMSMSIVIAYGAMFACFFGLVGPEDQDQFLVFHQLQLWNSQLFGFAKQWSPVMCSGLSLAGEPQVPFMSMSMAIGYVFGPLIGIKLATLIYFLIGWLGAYLYAKLWLKQIDQRVLAASLFIGNGFFICRLAFGHMDFIPFLSLPMFLWVLHRGLDSRHAVNWRNGVFRLAVTTLLMGAGIALAIDGSPVAIIHLMFWVGVYALALSWSERSWTPLALLICAAGVAAVLDAGYLWPMLEAQAEFPRRTDDSFTSALSLLWFALLPVRGKLLPANGNGHELSVFIGPVVGYLLWTYRGWLSSALPRSIKTPLLTVAIVSIVLGMGSLKPLHVPTWLSPFDLLRPLPGFRSLGVTGRFWGFLALPLSLLGAAALWRFVCEAQCRRKLRWWLGAALTLQLGFQIQTVAGHWAGSHPYRGIAAQNQFRAGPEGIEYVTIDASQMQGQFITPTRAVLNCYDMDDFIRADIDVGKQLVRQVAHEGYADNGVAQANGAFASWNHMRLMTQFASPTSPQSASAATVQFTLNQAFNRHWRADECDVSRGERGNLVLRCPVRRLERGPIDVFFQDELSATAAAISIYAWRAWCVLCGCVLLSGLLVYARRTLIASTGVAHPTHSAPAGEL